MVGQRLLSAHLWGEVVASSDSSPRLVRLVLAYVSSIQLLLVGRWEVLKAHAVQVGHEPVFYRRRPQSPSWRGRFCRMEESRK